MFGAMDLGITDDSERAGHEQAAQIAVTLLVDTAEPVLAPARCCFGTSPIQAEKLRPERKVFGSATPLPGPGQHRTDAWTIIQPQAHLIGSMPSSRSCGRTQESVP